MSTIPVDLGRSFVHDGHRLVYDVYGDSDQVVIYTHGLLIDSELNRGIAQALAEQGDRVVLLDLLGHGRSDKPTRATDYRIDSYADQVIGLMDHLGLDQAVLGGISLGANVSLFAAARYPERVRALVLEMPVLERAVPAAALLFAPMILLAHYGRPLMRFTSDLLARRRARASDRSTVCSTAPRSHPRRLPPCCTACSSDRSLRPRSNDEPSPHQLWCWPTATISSTPSTMRPTWSSSCRGPCSCGPAHPLELRLRPQRLTHEIVTFLGDLRPATMRPRPRHSASK